MHPARGVSVGISHTVGPACRALLSWEPCVPTSAQMSFENQETMTTGMVWILGNHLALILCFISFQEVGAERKVSDQHTIYF